MIKHLRSEARFIEYSLDAVLDYFAQFGNTLICQEVGVGNSIADLVGLIVEGNSLPDFEKSYTITESIVLAHLRNFGATRIDLLEKRCGVKSGVFRNDALSWLEEIGAISFGAGGQISLHDGYLFPRTIVAIEAKLQRWRDALDQAIAYQQYADESYVLLPSEFANAALSNLDKFRKSGIGLLVFEKGSGIQVQTQAEVMHNHGWRRDYVFSALVSQSESPEWS